MIVNASQMIVRNGPGCNSLRHKLFLITGNAIYRGNIENSHGLKKSSKKAVTNGHLETLLNRI